jgi:hypothetical protein
LGGYATRVVVAPCEILPVLSPGLTAASAISIATAHIGFTRTDGLGRLLLRGSIGAPLTFLSDLLELFDP